MIFSALAEETLGQVAVGRGRIAYCRESVDLLRVVKPLDVARVPDIKLCARYDQRLPDGVAVLEARHSRAPMEIGPTSFTGSCRRPSPHPTVCASTIVPSWPLVARPK
jgi:hypothetical protein